MIKNKAIAIILSVLTFILGSILFTWIIFYLAKIPFSSIWEGQNQLYVFSAILLSAVLASMVYGRGSKERASNVAKILNEELEIEIKGENIRGLLDMLERFPPFVVNLYVSMNINAVGAFENQMEDYNTQLTDESLLKIRKAKSQMTDDDFLKLRRIIETPVPELQSILHEIYLETNLEQFEILADPKAESFITLNLQELKRVLFKE